MTDDFKVQIDAAKAAIPGEVLKLQKDIVSFICRDWKDRAPVGQPAIWKVNQLPGGKRRKKKDLRKPKGYVGGHYRHNIQVIQLAQPQELPGTGDPTAAYTAEVGRIQPYSVVAVVNAVPYAEALERGHSSQAPQGVAAIVIEDVRAQFGGS